MMLIPIELESMSANVFIPKTNQTLKELEGIERASLFTEFIK